MNDFDMEKSKDMFRNYLKWRKEFRVDMLPKVNYLNFKIYSFAKMKILFGRN